MDPILQQLLMPHLENSGLEPGEINAFDFLNLLAATQPDLAADARQTLDEVLDRIDYSLCDEKNLPKPEIVTRPNMPLNIGGYHMPGTDYIAISPLALLYSSKAEIFRIIQHEVNHYAGIMDEGVTDLTALLQTKEEGLDVDSTLDISS